VNPWKSRILLFLFVTLLAALGQGCSSTPDEQNVSTRPWNAPKGWEFGVPGMPDQYR
jgi:hypothetical protein